MRNRLVRLSILTLAMLLGIVGLAEANGYPHRVVMTYLPEMSNWGPAGATGIGEFVPIEGEVRFTALGLPREVDGVYVLWLQNSKTKEALALGEPKIDDQDVAGLNRVLPEAIPDKGWDLLLVSVEKPGAARTAPGDRRSIAGWVNDRNSLPALQLPNTGGAATAEPATATQSLPIAPLAGALVVGGAAGGAISYLVARRRASRRI